MKKEMVMNVNLSNHGVDCNVDVPAAMFFELMGIVPEMLGRIGLKNSEKEYFSMLGKIQSEYKTVSSNHWDEIDLKGKEFMRRCQIVAVLGAHLYDIPLQLSGDGLAGFMVEAGAVNITDEVNAGLIPWSNNGESNLPHQ